MPILKPKNVFATEVSSTAGATAVVDSTGLLVVLVVLVILLLLVLLINATGATAVVTCHWVTGVVGAASDTVASRATGKCFWCCWLF